MSFSPLLLTSGVGGTIDPSHESGIRPDDDDAKRLGIDGSMDILGGDTAEVVEEIVPEFIPEVVPEIEVSGLEESTDLGD